MLSLVDFVPRFALLHNGSKATGNGYELGLDGRYGTLVVRVLGITSATIVFEAVYSTLSGDSYSAISGTDASTGRVASSTSSNSTFIFDVRGVQKFRARISSYTSGTIYVHAGASAQTPVASSVAISGSPVVAAGKVNVSNTNNHTITATFNRVAVINDGPAELRLCVNGDSTNPNNNIIYVRDGEAFEDSLAGTSLHYSIVNDSCTFRYLLR